MIKAQMNPERELKEYLAHLRVERGLADHTLAAYRRDLDRYCAYLLARGFTSWDQIEHSIITEYMKSLTLGDDDHRPLAPSSVTRSVAALRGWHRFLVSEGRALADPTAGVATPGQGRKLPHALSVTEVTALITTAGAGDDAIGLRDKALLEVLYGTGARISEAVALTADDLDAETSTVRLLGKGNKERLVPWGRYAQEAVEAYQVRARPELAARGRGFTQVFLNQRGNPLSRQSAWAVIQQAAQRAGIDQPISPHTFRHSYATHLLNGGADIRVVQELLGHASVTTTQIYTHVSAESLREVYQLAHPRARRGPRT